jgi:hypothetical protein
VPADMYVTTEVHFCATLRYRPNRTFRTGEKAGLRSDTGTSESTSLLPTFQFAAQSCSWEAPRDYYFCRALTKIFRASSFKLQKSCCCIYREPAVAWVARLRTGRWTLWSPHLSFACGKCFDSIESASRFLDLSRSAQAHMLQSALFLGSGYSCYWRVETTRWIVRRKEDG